MERSGEQEASGGRRRRRLPGYGLAAIIFVVALAPGLLTWAAGQLPMMGLFFAALQVVAIPLSTLLWLGVFTRPGTAGRSHLPAALTMALVSQIAGMVAAGLVITTIAYGL